MEFSIFVILILIIPIPLSVLSGILSLFSWQKEENKALTKNNNH